MGHTDRQSDLVMVETAVEDTFSRNIESLPGLRSTRENKLKRRPIDRWEGNDCTGAEGGMSQGSTTLLTFEVTLIVVVLVAETINALCGAPLTTADSSFVQVAVPADLLPVAHSDSRLSPETLAVSLSSGIIALYVLSCRWICCRFLKMAAQELDESPP